MISTSFYSSECSIRKLLESKCYFKNDTLEDTFLGILTIKHKFVQVSLGGLNKDPIYHTYPLPTVEEVCSRLNRGKSIWKINLLVAYVQVDIEE